MKKSLLELYALAVCFVTIVCSAITIGVGVYNIIGIYKPEFTLPSHEYERHQTNEKFAMQIIVDYPNEGRKTNMSEEEKTRQRVVSYDTALKSESRGSVQALVKVVIITIISVLLFIIHWLIAIRARETNKVAG
jgi:hypothetical protein